MRLVRVLPFLWLCSLASAADPLSTQVEAIIASTAKDQQIPLSPPADDAEFLRRAWLDFAGTIPSASETRAFLADRDPQKRDKLIDSLLDRPEYASTMADRFHVMLMERLGDHPDWTAYLRTSFATNRPWDRMVADMLRGDSDDPATRGAVFFLSKRLENYGQQPVDHSALTRDVGRLFLGKNYQCCECHDHLFIEDYKQQHFQGLHAFFRNASLVDAKLPRVAEKPTVDKLKFASVFTKVEMATAPALPDGEMVMIPMLKPGEEFAVSPDRKKNLPGVPKFRTLAAAAERIPAPENRDFARNSVNRIWFLLMGRGLVAPLDLAHSRNPASHPAVLELLSTEFVAHKYDLKWLFRELAKTPTYQRSSALPPGRSESPPRYFATALEKRLSAEVNYAAVLKATGEKGSDALRAKFLKAFANQPREPEDEITPSLKAALFLLHDPAVLELVQPRSGNLIDRLAKLPDPAVADELFLSVLTRLPSAEEKALVGNTLAKHSAGRTAALGRLAWSLFASAEFQVNH